MSEDLRKISARNMSDAIQILNVSSRGMVCEYNLDWFGFLLVWGYWNLSYEYSFISYVNEKPAAVMLTSVEPQSRDAYTFYWGTLPQFRNPRLSFSLVNTCSQKLHDDGYIFHYADSAPERHVSRYRHVQFTPLNALLEMSTFSPDLPAPDPTYQVRPITTDDISELSLAPGETLHWCQRPSFLNHAAAFVQILGAFQGNSLKAYAIVLTKAFTTMLSDIRSPGHCVPACNQLLRYIVNQDFRPPLKVSYVLENSYCHQLLASAGFTVTRSFHSIVRDLRATCEPVSCAR